MAGQDSEQQYQLVFTCRRLKDPARPALRGTELSSAGSLWQCRTAVLTVCSGSCGRFYERVPSRLHQTFRIGLPPGLRSSRRGTLFSCVQPVNGRRSGCSFSMRLNAATRPSGKQPGNGCRMEMPAGLCSHLLPAPDFPMIKVLHGSMLLNLRASRDFRDIRESSACCLLIRLISFAQSSSMPRLPSSADCANAFWQIRPTARFVRGSPLLQT